jgi:hypothetical protein
VIAAATPGMGSEPVKDSSPEEATAGAARLWLWVSILAATVAIAASVIGEAVDRIYAFETANWTAQTIAQDVVNVAIAYPAMIILAALALRGSFRAYLAWLGTLVFSVYSYAIYAFDLHFGPLFPAYVAVLGLSAYALIGGIAALDLDHVKRRFDPHCSVRLPAWYLIVAGVLAYLMWLIQDISDMVAGGRPESLREVGLPSNPVHVLDMAFLLPACIAVGMLLRRRQRLAYAVAPALLVALSLFAVAIVVIMIVSDARGIAASWPVAGGMGLSAVLALVALRSLLAAVDVKPSSERLDHAPKNGISSPSLHPPDGVRRVVVSVETFVGLGAVYGGIELLRDAEGFGVKEAWLRGSPFGDYTVPGLFLLIVIGGGMLTAAVAAIRRASTAVPAAFTMGLTLLGFITVETMILGYRTGAQAVLLGVCGAAALVLAGIAVCSATGHGSSRRSWWRRGVSE